MPKGYVILTESIKDPEGMKAYGRAAGAAMGGVNILAVDTKATVIEGTWHGDQTVVRTRRSRAGQWRFHRPDRPGLPFKETTALLSPPMRASGGEPPSRS